MGRPSEMDGAAVWYLHVDLLGPIAERFDLSRSAVRRLFKQKAVDLDDSPMDSHVVMIAEHLLPMTLRLKVGKHRFMTVMIQTDD
jgi:tyrosyl-tRNA synthetase